MLKQKVDRPAEDAGQRVNAAAQHHGDLPAHHIPQHPAAYPGDKPQENAEKGILTEAHRNAGAHPNDGKHAEPQGIKDIVDTVDLLQVAEKAGAAAVGQQKHRQRRSQRHDGVEGVAEHGGRDTPQQHIPEAAAAQCGGQPQEQYAEAIQPALQRHHGPRNGKGNGAQHLQYNKNSLGHGHSVASLG